MTMLTHKTGNHSATVADCVKTLCEPGIRSAIWTTAGIPANFYVKNTGKNRKFGSNYRSFIGLYSPNFIGLS